MSGRVVERKVGVATTSGAVAVTVCSSSDATALSLLASAFRVEARLVGRQTSGVGSGSSISFYKGTAGQTIAGVTNVLDTIGTLLSTLPMVLDGSSATLVTATAAIDVSGNAIRLRATGVAAIDMEWFGELKIWLN